jgi:nucleoside-diphosphate-sugar epimerase
LSKSVEVVEGDVRDRGSVREFMIGADGATVFHIAGVVHPKRFVREFYEVNETGTRHVVESAVESGVRRVVHVSSNSPIGCNPREDHVFDAAAPYHPYMNYGKSKQRAEEIVQGAGGRVETAIIRPPWFYGPYQPPRQTQFFSMIKSGGMPLLGKGTNRRSMAYLDNICQGLRLCEQVDAANGQVYWIADARPYPMHEILDTVERLMEQEFGIAVSHKRLKLPSIVGDIALGVDIAVQGVGLYHQKFHVLSEMNKTIACSVAKARTELGYEPRIDLEEGMRRSLRWVLDQGIEI